MPMTRNGVEPLNDKCQSVLPVVDGAWSAIQRFTVASGEPSPTDKTLRFALIALEDIV